jgi:hypothetical protein
MPENPATGLLGCAASPTSTGTGTPWLTALPGTCGSAKRRPDDTFSGWQALGVPPLDPADAGSPGRCMGVYRRRQQRHRPRHLPPLAPAHATSWTSWSPLLGDNDFHGDIVAATDYRGGLDIVTPREVSTGAAGLSHKRRLPNGTWTDWTMLGNPPGGLSEDIIPVLVNGAGSPLGLELFAVAVDSTIWHNAQTAAGPAVPALPPH